MGRWIRSCLLGIVLLAALALGAAPASAEEPSVEYEAIVNVTYAGLYEEHYVDNLGDRYDLAVNFQLLSPYAFQWLSNGTLQSLSNLEAIPVTTGTMKIEVAKSGGGYFEPEYCDYTPREPVTGGRFPVFRTGPPGELEVHAFMGYGSNYLQVETPAPGAYECNRDVIMTPGAPVDDPHFEAAFEPVVQVNVLTHPLYFQDVSAEGPLVGGTGNYKINGAVQVVSEPIPHPPTKPVEKEETNPPTEPPVSPPGTPTETKPKVPKIVREIGAPILHLGGGGNHGGPTKLKTGLRVTCPTTTTDCEVAGVLVASPPSAPGAEKASGANAKRRKVTIGSTSFKLAAGASSAVTIALSRSGLALLRKDHHLPVSITVSVAAPGMGSVTQSRSLTLRLPGKH
ncbi:MAG: hypothetical protein WB998_13835 [Solirubrobacteraceae bacterium]